MNRCGFRPKSSGAKLRDRSTPVSASLAQSGGTSAWSCSTSERYSSAPMRPWRPIRTRASRSASRSGSSVVAPAHGRLRMTSTAEAIPIKTVATCCAFAWRARGAFASGPPAC